MSILSNSPAAVLRAGAFGLAVIFSGSPILATDVSSQTANRDREGAIEAVESYHQALADQDSAGARNLLATNAVVLESGHAETLEEYLGHHLGADMQFASQVPGSREVLQAVVEGDVAWVASTSETEGEFRGQMIRATGVELMVLSKVAGEWKIRAIHWSSRRRESE